MNDVYFPQLTQFDREEDDGGDELLLLLFLPAQYFLPARFLLLVHCIRNQQSVESCTITTWPSS